MAGEAVIPLFPLSVVLLPGMSLPLHIFEERYKLMIGECIERRVEFGVVLGRAERLHDVGCTAEIRQVLRRYSDGRLDILSVGVRRFRVVELREGKPYLEAAIEQVQDELEPDGEEPEGLAALADRGTALLVQLTGMLGRPADLAGLRRLSPQELSFHMAAAEGFSLDERQQLLESTSVRERLVRGVEGLERILERVRRTIEARRLTGGNGHFKEAFRG